MLHAIAIIALLAPVEVGSSAAGVDASAAAGAAAAAVPCEARAVDPMFKVLPGAPAPPALTKPLAAARGELVHLQIAVTTGRLAAGARASAAVAGLGHATVRALAYTDMTLPAGVLPAAGIGPQSKPGLFPDALPPLGGAAADVLGAEHIVAGAPQVFWLTLAVPRDASVGVHQGMFRAGACAAAFALQVSNFSLPATPTQITGAAFEAENIGLWTSPQCTALRFGAGLHLWGLRQETAA